MRLASLPVLALAALASLAAGLAGCSVNVEGAKCHVVGATDECPSGQRCGTDWNCSVRAAACEPCVAGATACRVETPGSVMECFTDDPVCGTWKVAAGGACVAGLQTCKRSALDVPTCACDHWTVIPGGSAAACTRPSITGALIEAMKFPGPVVRLGGGATATYGNELDDSAPIVLPAGVTVIGDETAPVAVPLNRIIEVRGSVAAPNALAALVVEPGASVRGVTVRRVDASAPLVGVVVDGASPAGGNSLLAVQVDAGTAGFPFAVGLRISAAGAVAVSDVRVSGATVAGLEVNRSAATDAAVVTGSTFDQNQVGVSLIKGDLTLSGSTLKRSIWEGFVSATGVSNLTSLSLVDSFITWNGRGGVRLFGNKTVAIIGTRICGNTGFSRSPPGATRMVGGIYTVGDPPMSLTFQGNLLFDNSGDQVLVAASGASWDLTGSVSNSCPANSRNTFAKYALPGVGLAAVGATVVAKFNSWGNATPDIDRDFVSVAGSVDVGTGNGDTNFCSALPPDDPSLTCPLP